MIDSDPTKWDSAVFLTVVYALALLVPIAVVPFAISNSFYLPKSLLMVVGVSVAAGTYAFLFLRGYGMAKSETSTPFVVLFLILMNFISFFYTQNYFYTIVGAVLNVTCLLLFYFCSLYLDGKGVFRLLLATVASGVLVSIETSLEFFGIFLLYSGGVPGVTITGTIGNPNYLGAYLLFPLFACLAFLLLLRREKRWLAGLLLSTLLFAFLLSRARAAWIAAIVTLPVFFLLLKKIYAISLRRAVMFRFRRLALWALLLVSLLTAFWVSAPEALRTRLRFSDMINSETLKTRLFKYGRASLWLFMESPLFGTGLGSYRNMVYLAQADLNRADPHFFEDYPAPKPRKVHNEYLESLNDGGLLASGGLLLFLVMVMRHGWLVIRTESVAQRDRVLAATAFATIIAILSNALFFFPFRLNSTLFMTVLMLGILEALYLRANGLVSQRRARKLEGRYVLILLVFLSLVAVNWYTVLKPILGEMEHMQFKNALVRGDLKKAESHILKAVELQPYDSSYAFEASQFYMKALKDYTKANDYIELAITDFNGDLTLWSLYFFKGLLKYHLGSLFEARDALEKSLYYYPKFEEAQEMLHEVERVLRENENLIIRLR